MLLWLWSWIETVFYVCGAVSLLTFFVPQLVQWFVLKEQNLKEKYNARWALVTGGSSGIGRAIVEKLAKQGLNVVIVALDDDLLRDFFKQIQKEYPSLQFRSVGVDLGNKDSSVYMDPIIKATEDISINLLFNNAGYITIGLFTDLGLDRQLKNAEVNMMSAVRITHHFSSKMVQKGTKGAIVFTSSPAGNMSSPFATMYGSTKSFLTEFGISLAAELRGDGIDVLVVRPSPVDTNFYKVDTASKSATLLFFSKLVYPPTSIASAIFKSVGNYGVIMDQGFYGPSLNLMFKFIDFNFLSYIIAIFGPISTEYKKLSAERRSKQK